jgi:hypothetical protein
VPATMMSVTVNPTRRRNPMQQCSPFPNRSRSQNERPNLKRRK